ncbi:MAG TPA: caspase family protein [Telluria sp.]|jgi:hypothetical protein
MSKGMALLVGLLAVDPSKYGGASYRTAVGHKDAEDMWKLLKNQGFELTPPLLTPDAKINNVRGAILSAANALHSGDTFVFVYSGHGMKMADQDNDEPDGLDETLCLYDGQLVDDDLHDLWKAFKKGVRVVLVVNSCYSGSVNKHMVAFHATDAQDVKGEERALKAAVSMRPFGAKKTDDAHVFESRDALTPQRDVEALVMLFSACEERSLALEGEDNSIFIDALKNVWARHDTKPSYRKLHAEVEREMKNGQVPVLTMIPRRDDSFFNAKAFHI